MTVPHPLNWYAGWTLVSLAFVTGALIGLGFHREEFLGGYQSLRRRMTRLGHIALAALGLMNVVYALSPWPLDGTWQASVAGVAFIVGGISMPTICFLTAWREPWRSLFFIPVVSLLTAVVATLLGGR